MVASWENRPARTTCAMGSKGSQRWISWAQSGSLSVGKLTGENSMMPKASTWERIWARAGARRVAMA